MRGFERN